MTLLNTAGREAVSRQIMGLKVSEKNSCPLSQMWMTHCFWCREKNREALAQNRWHFQTQKMCKKIRRRKLNNNALCALFQTNPLPVLIKLKGRSHSKLWNLNGEKWKRRKDLRRWNCARLLPFLFFDDCKESYFVPRIYIRLNITVPYSLWLISQRRLNTSNFC